MKGQLGRVVWEDHAEKGDTEKMKDQDPVEGMLDCTIHNLGHIWRPCQDTRSFTANVRKGSGGHGSAGGEEDFQHMTFGIHESTWVLPVSESLYLVIWPASKHQHKRQDHEAAHDEEFERRDVELNLTWQSVADIVETRDDEKEYGDPYSGVDVFRVEP
jgi:hypothetical protein